MWRVRLTLYNARVAGTSARRLAVVVGAALIIAAGAARADEKHVGSPTVSSVLNDLGFRLTDPGPDKNAITFTKTGLLVPTPWGDFEATIVSTPVDRMVRVPLSPNTAPAQQRFQPYVTAGARKSVDDDEILEQARAASFGDTGRTNLKAGAGVLFKLDANVELFGEYQFMRLRRDSDGKGSPGPLGTSLDASGFSLGISVRY
jgi:hypothetical protein